MASRIVTYAHRQKRPPRKLKAIVLDVRVVAPAIKPGNDNRAELAPQPPTVTSQKRVKRKRVSKAKPAAINAAAIVTAKKLGRRQRLERPRNEVETARIVAWLEQAKWGRGPADV